MSKINVKDIQELRERTGVGISDCKKVLIEAEGDLEKAADLLRQKGLASVAKKAGKIATEGAVVAKVIDNYGVIIELNSQTDFVAKNEKFQELLNTLIEVACKNKCKTIDEVKAITLPSGEKVEEYIAITTATIGEKLDFRRYQAIEANDSQTIFTYTHPIGSKIAVLGKLSNNNEDLGKDLGMHIAAYQPQPEYINRDEIPQSAFDKETEFELGREDLANKPDSIKEKIVTGRVEKALTSKVLLEQDFIKDSSLKVKDLLTKHENTVESFVRFNLGEGLVKKEENFADEVAAQTQSKN